MLLLFQSIWGRLALLAIPLLVFFWPRIWVNCIRGQRLVEFRTQMVEERVKPLFVEGETILSMSIPDDLETKTVPAISGTGTWTARFFPVTMAGVSIVFFVNIYGLSPSAGDFYFLYAMLILSLLVMISPYSKSILRVLVATSCCVYVCDMRPWRKKVRVIPGEDIHLVAVARQDRPSINDWRPFGLFTQQSYARELTKAISKTAVLARRKSLLGKMP